MKTSTITALFILLAAICACVSKETKVAAKRAQTLDARPLLGDGFGINNVMLLVDNLDSARKDYANLLGFALPSKPEKGMYDGTLSAAVGLPDLFALEIVGVKDTALVQKKPSFLTSFLKQKEGVRYYSLATSAADSTYGWLRLQGFTPDSLQAGRFNDKRPKGWTWDDGGPQWRMVNFNSKNAAAYLPGFTQYLWFNYAEGKDDWRPYAWRKYYDSQANGVVGLSLLRIIVSDMKAARHQFKRIGLSEVEASDTSAIFKVANNHRLHLLSPKKSGSESDQFLQSHGPGVYAIRFEVKNFSDTRAFLQKKLPAKALVIDSVSKHVTVRKEFAHGVQIEFAEEPAAQAQLAKIYSFKEGSKLDTVSAVHASRLYTKYCSLCHGKDREGYAADFAPSLRSGSLMATTQSPRSSYNYLHHTIAYGRAGTAMAPYAKSQGGPLHEEDIDLLLQWLHEASGVKKPIEMSAKPVLGNAGLGKTLYAKHCAVCHGEKGEGVRAPALANPMFLATASDAFLRYTISEGRDGTPMPSFKDSLRKTDINAVTAYLRSRASGWNAPEAIAVKKPMPKDYVLNPRHKGPAFTLRAGRYLPAEQLLKALKDSVRIIMLDARSEAAWHQTHIPGAISVPYYQEPDKFIKDIPNDSTWIVVYCACPHAASTQVVNTLKRFGYKHTAILDEGILVWAQRGYPVQYGNAGLAKK